METESNDELGEIRFRIIKSMLAEFPELKIYIKKEILLDPKRVDEELKIEGNLENYISRIAETSRKRHNRNIEEDNIESKPDLSQEENFPLWAKLGMATVKYDRNGKKYYVFR